MATRTISQRIALTGSEEIRKQLAALGEWGEKAFRDIQAAAEKLRGPGAEFARNMDRARKRVRELGQEFDKVGSKIRNFGAGVSLGLTAPLVLAAKQSVTAWNEQVDAIQKVEAALASTGGVSGQTSAGLQKMASELQGITTFGDEAVLSMQAVLLTFTNIRGQRFEQATKAILNVATALGMDLQSAALQVGKALNDPRQGITALSRAGIQFTDVQKANIKQMVEMGDVAGAQGHHPQGAGDPVRRHRRGDGEDADRPVDGGDERARRRHGAGGRDHRALPHAAGRGHQGPGARLPGAAGKHAGRRSSCWPAWSP